jgi:hypothetical protein
MKLSDLFKSLSYGELSNLAMAAEGNGSIVTADQPKLVLHANEGLLKLYTRFILKEKDVVIQTVDHITNYHFLKKYALSVYQVGQIEYPYIQDLVAEPFQEDMIKILAVYNDCGQELPLNDDERLSSLFTPQARVLQVPRAVTGIGLSVLYQARHMPLTLGELEAEIELPDVLHSALSAYIAYKVYTNMNTAESTAKAQEHLGNYEGTCLEAETKDLLSTSISTTNSRFKKRGWI